MKLQDIQLNKLISSGNKKLPNTTAIFNTTSAHDCPSIKKGLCAACKSGVKCYAIKSEYAYHPGVLPYRRRQEKFWDSTTAQEFVNQFLAINRSKRVPYVNLRIGESGDFKNQKSLDKAEEIAKLLSRKGIKTYCYTSRSDLNFKGCKYLIVSGSGFMKEGINNEFKIVKNMKERPFGYGKCKGDCKICNRCQIRGRKTVVLAH